MKRIFIALAVILAVPTVNAQVKSADALKKAVESATVATKDPKKAAKTATWIKLGDTYVDAYDAALGAGIVGYSRQELTIIMGNVKPQSSEAVVISGQNYTKDTYPTMNYYFGEDDRLSFIEITNPIYEDALDRALESYIKASEIDITGKSAKDINAAIKTVADSYMNQGVASYNLGNYGDASLCFEKAANASAASPVPAIDTMAIYNAGFASYIAKDYGRSSDFFKRCIELGYADNGEVYSKLGDAYMNLADSLSAKNVLEEGFSIYPQCNSIVIGLINYYIGSGDDPNTLFTLLDKAKAMDPKNASLYYVEGDIHKKLGDTDSAVESYKKAAEIDPNYEFSYIGLGVLYYDKAVELQEAALKEVDDAKYMALFEESGASLKKAIEPFEKAFEITKDNQIKASIAEYLKNIYFRFRDDGPEYTDGYQKYNSIVTNGL